MSPMSPVTVVHISLGTINTQSGACSSEIPSRLSSCFLLPSLEHRSPSYPAPPPATSEEHSLPIPPPLCIAIRLPPARSVLIVGLCSIPIV